MEIRIRYRRRDETDTRLLHLSPDEYFDPLEDGETYSVRSVAKYQDDFAYTPHPADELSWTVLEIVDGNSWWRVRTQLLDGKRSMMTHSEASDGDEEIIHTTEIRPGCCHIIRTFKQRGMSWTVLMNSLIFDQPSQASDLDEDFCSRWTFEERKAFGDVR